MSEHGLRHPVASFAQLDREALVAVLTTVSEHSRAGIVLLDERGEALFMNTRFQQLWELPPELVKSGSGESRRTHLQSLVTQPDMICRLHRFSGDERSRLFEEEVVLKDGRTFAASTAPVMDDSGAVHGQLVMYRDRTTLKHTEKERNFFQSHDAVTGLLNRSTMFHSVEHLLQEYQHKRYALIAIRFTRFTRLQQLYGPPFADRVLQHCARQITHFFGLHTLISRHDAAEFLVCLPYRDTFTLEDQLSLLIDELSQEVTIESVPVIVQAHAGMSVFPADGTSANDLVSAALLALERSVQQGEQRVISYRADDGRLSDERALIEQELTSASRGQGLHLLYQPMYDLRTEQLAGFECLLRWQSPRLGHVSPELFVPYAEETGLIIPIGEWVLRRACEQAAAWVAAGFSVAPVSVNVSVAQLLAGEFDEVVANILRSTGCSPFLLHLELTESALASNLTLVSKTLQRLRLMGIKISIDDFGTGFSSLSYLKHFRVDSVKIDRSFTEGIGGTREENALVQGVISLGQSLGLTVIAEGVETAEQLRFLKYSQCDQVQGFYLHRPLNVKQAEVMLQEEDLALPVSHGALS